MFISALDQTIVATAVPTIASELHSSSGYVWVMTAYLLAAAAGGPVWAKLSDIWGRKVIILLAVAWFFLSSIVCAAAISMDMLIAGRALQGTAAGGLLQLAFITISDLFSVRWVDIQLNFYITKAKVYIESVRCTLDSPRSCGLWRADLDPSLAACAPNWRRGDGVSG